MLVFIAIALSVYGLANFYILRRGWQALAGHPQARWIWLAVFLALVLSFPAGRFLLGHGQGPLAVLMARVGAFHLAVMLNLLMGVLLVDLLRLVNAFRPFFPASWSKDPGRTGLALFVLVAGTAALVIAGGAVNAARPRTREVSLAIDKAAGGRRSLTMAVVSDIHLGTIAGSSRLRMVVERANALHPDIVLMPGDIVDESVTAREEEAMTSVFQGLRAPLGVYAVPGNHEYFGGLERNLSYLRKWGVRVLQDEAVLVDGSFYIVGRRDPTALRYQEVRRPIEVILERSGVDRSLPLILLDHQPVHLEEAEKAGIDLELCGHTHAGQLFPINLINKLVYELNWGSLTKGTTHYDVTCGIGTWGPPVRTSSRPEIVRIRLTFKESP
jgi:predicted MPP superfamily phosphohydrolase